MERNDIVEKVADEKGFYGANKMFFVEAMRDRFTKSCNDPCYMGEWADRVLQGRWWNCGDVDTRIAFLRSYQKIPMEQKERLYWQIVEICNKKLEELSKRE